MRFETILVVSTGITGIFWALHRKAVARSDKKKSQKEEQTSFVEFCGSFFPILLLVLVLRSFLAEPFRIPTGSMKPSLLEGDFILVNKYTYGIRPPVWGKALIPVGKPKRGDVLVFRQGDKDLIKRVIGVPGDTIRYENKSVILNGVALPTQYKTQAFDDQIPAKEFVETIDELTHRIYQYPPSVQHPYKYTDVKVPENSYFVMGDNRDNSEDSRVWGFVSEDEIIGKAVVVWFSVSGRFGDVVKSILGSSTGVGDIRWGRIGKVIGKSSD